MKKRAIALLIVLAMALVLFAGCGSQGEGGPDISPDNQIKDTLEDLLGKIYGITKIDQEIAIETNEIDLGNSDFVLYHLGLDDVSEIEEAVVSEALMTTQPYSMVLARAKKGGDVDQLAKEIRKGIDPQKWICVMADDVSVTVHGDVVLVVMINTNMADVATSETIVSAMDEVSGIKGKEIK